MTRTELIAKLDGERRTAWDDCEYDMSRLLEEIIEDVRGLEPEPPTPEDEARREREGRALARAAAISLTVCRLGAAILTDDEQAILREWAARGRS